jgi:hypothetical protein
MKGTLMFIIGLCIFVMYIGSYLWMVSSQNRKQKTEFTKFKA